MNVSPNNLACYIISNDLLFCTFLNWRTVSTSSPYFYVFIFSVCDPACMNGGICAGDTTPALCLCPPGLSGTICQYNGKLLTKYRMCLEISKLYTGCPEKEKLTVTCQYQLEVNAVNYQWCLFTSWPLTKTLLCFLRCLEFGSNCQKLPAGRTKSRMNLSFIEQTRDDLRKNIAMYKFVIQVYQSLIIIGLTN